MKKLKKLLDYLFFEFNYENAAGLKYNDYKDYIVWDVTRTVGFKPKNKQGFDIIKDYIDVEGHLQFNEENKKLSNIDNKKGIVEVSLYDLNIVTSILNELNKSRFEKIKIKCKQDYIVLSNNLFKVFIKKFI